MTVDELHFAGKQEAPTELSKVLSRPPRIGEGDRPAELDELARHKYTYITGEEEGEPNVNIEQVESVDDSTWRVDIERGENRQVNFVPGNNARLEDPEIFLEEIDEFPSVSGYRPDWMTARPSPREPPQREFRDLRRLNGRPIDPLRVWGSDDRREFKDRSWPWGLIGRIEVKTSNSGWTGSGALVGGRVVVTASHVVPWGASSWSMRFVPAYYEGSSLHGSGVESYVTDARGYTNSSDVAGYDWAIVRLQQPLGNSLGYFGFNGYSTSWNNQPYWSIAGYPGSVALGRRPSRQNGISIFDVDSDSHGGEELESQTADLSPGNSGGPMFAWWGNDPRLVGVVSGYEEDVIFYPPFREPGNVMASGPGFTNLIAWGRTNWPA